MKGLKINELNIGDKDFFQKTISESDVYLYAGITGDLNSAHINEVEAKSSMFKGRIAHGMLTAGLISTVLGMKLPGPGTIYLGQELKFKAPVRFGDTIKAEVEVIEKNEFRNIVKLKTTCINQDGKVVLTGVATAMPPK
ncbi:MaoC family dehydratase [Clostridium perfringens]|uniref:MaoC family dehydratase n=1 Tax=Clostridium perfringens TaxID=1502 RepID=UPI001A20F824|nr:MaoC family dehydratase [Clostridium perfringens]ELC8345824.1 MaoC family dehydratase [Clostridium perfringens]HAT4340767.1 MaoC family dehydratase [Clostridium perfringens]HAT4346505.1 MaoC family dehydratase [Clostridium perfringens]